MSYYSITAKLRKQEDNIYTYIYALDDMDLKEENCGMFTMEEETFYNLPEDMHFLSNTIGEELINGKIVQLKACPNGSLLGDGIDCYVIYVAELLIKERIKKNAIPEKLGLINAELLLEKLQDEETVKEVIEKGVLTREDIDSLINTIKNSERAN